MPPISDAAMEACRHQGWRKSDSGPRMWVNPQGYAEDDGNLPRPDEDHGDCMRYLLFVVSQGYGLSHLKVSNNLQYAEVEILPGHIQMDGPPLAAITAACNAAMRAVAESEGEA